MERREPVEDRIARAIEAGELTATQGVGEPLPDLRNDPMWWVKGLLERERAADAFEDVLVQQDRELALAVAADDLSEARVLLAELNRNLISWNSKVEEKLRVPVHDEIWLLEKRQIARS